MKRLIFLTLLIPSLVLAQPNAGTIDISDDTNLSASLPITLTDDDIGFDFSTNNTWTGTNQFDDTVTISGLTDGVVSASSGVLSGGYTVDTSTDTNLTTSSPITLTGDDIGFDFSTNNTWTGTNGFDDDVTIDIRTLYAITAGGSLGSTETFDCSTGSYFTGTLDANIAITVSNVGDGQRVAIALSYTSSQKTISWTGVDSWAAGAEPTLGPDSGEVMLITLTSDGTNVYGVYNLFS